MNLKFLWIGKYASEKIFQEMAQKGYKDPAAQVSQSNIIHALDELNVKLDTLNAYNVPYKYTDKYVKEQVWSRTGYSKDVSIGYRNIMYFSHIIRTWKLKLAAKKWIAENSSEDSITILVYGMQSSLLAAAIEIKKRLYNSKIYLMVPDLPQYMDMDMSILKKMLKQLDWLKIKYQMESVDGYILYTKNMANFLNIPDDRWILMEGSIKLNEYKKTIAPKCQKKRISVMYSGMIDKKYGIEELLKAIELIGNENYEFWFTGMGNAVQAVIEQSKTDSRIKYLGFLPSRGALLEKQRQATMLINMRLSTEEGSAYCFPSKILEYMATGRPVLTFKIKGIPDEYYKYLIEMKSTSPEDIVNAIKFVAQCPEEKRNQIGNIAKDFVVNNKNALIQTKKILNFINLQAKDKI